jgi:broad specificity phosphatase PhoE
VSVALPGIDASIETVDQLRDRSMGRLEGVRWPVEGPAYSEYDGLQIFTKPDESAESLADVALRLAPILQQAADSVREGKTVVLFTHGVIVAAAAFLLGSRPESGPIGFGEAWFYTDRYESSKAAVT